MANLIVLISINEITLMIENLDEVNRKRWKAAFYEELPEEQISIDVVGDMLDFINEQLEFENIQIPNVR